MSLDIKMSMMNTTRRAFLAYQKKDIFASACKKGARARLESEGTEFYLSRVVRSETP
jgi:hypothetical protein